MLGGEKLTAPFAFTRRALLLVLCLVLGSCFGDHGGSGGKLGGSRLGADGDPTPLPYTPPAEPNSGSALANAVIDSQPAGVLPGESAVTPDGAFTYRIPIRVPEGRLGLTPSLALSYNSRSGNGLLGIGWSVEGISRITRCRKVSAADDLVERVAFDLSDSFCLDGVKLAGTGGTYGADGAEYRSELLRLRQDPFDGQIHEHGCGRPRALHCVYEGWADSRVRSRARPERSELLPNGVRLELIAGA
jgi:Salmonella virulence plasmid 65kDa B protein